MIQRKKKKCLKCGEDKYIFSHGLCKECSMSNSAKKKMEKERDIRNKDNRFYEELWNKRPHVCFECGEPINGALTKKICHHIIEKQEQHKYSVDIRWNEELLVFLHWEEHDQVRTNIDKLPKVKAYTEQMKAKYEQYRIK